MKLQGVTGVKAVCTCDENCDELCPVHSSVEDFKARELELHEDAARFTKCAR